MSWVARVFLSIFVSNPFVDGPHLGIGTEIEDSTEVSISNFREKLYGPLAENPYLSRRV